MDKRKSYAKDRRRSAGRKPEDRRRHLTPRQSARRRKLRVWLLYSLLIFVVLGTGIALSLTVLFKIDTIEVVGETRYSQSEVIQASRIAMGQNLFLCKTGQGSADIEKELPYIQKAEISRKIPGKITIYVAEAVPAGSIWDTDKYIVVNSAGKALEYSQQPASGYPVIKGVELSQAQLAAQVKYKDGRVSQILQDITAALQKNNITKITQLDFTDLTSPNLIYDDRIKIKLGVASDIDYKMKVVALMLQDSSVETAKGEIDVSVAAETNRGYFRYSAAGQASSAAGAGSKTS